MYRNLTLEEDLALKKVITDRTDILHNQFAWRDVLGKEFHVVHPEITVTSGSTESQFSLAQVADTIGSALTDLLISRQTKQDGIFNDANRAFVSAVAHNVAKSLTKNIEDGGRLRLSENDLYLLIERALVENDAYDVAKSLAFRRSYERSGDVDVNTAPQTMPVRLIRRNGNVVPWSETKIEIAVRKAFLSIRESADPANDVAKAVTERVRVGEQAFVHIEDVQDMVEEELGRLGYFKAMRAYMAYRFERARYRIDHEEAPEDPNQDSMVVVLGDNGQSAFWDGLDLKKRITFASIGLDLCLTENEIERELRRSIGSEISANDLKQTIILNARTLIEKDADFAKFAGRILLTYIYEEVLDWDITRDGINGIKTAHRNAFKRHLTHGVSIKRIHPDLLAQFNIDTLADALDPSADLDFDYLGVQTMYDRYLIVDKTGAKQRRLETPQFFWMRVAMGLFKTEPENREQWVIRLYNLYKGRRPISRGRHFRQCRVA